MSLGDWEHTFVVELAVSIRSKSEEPDETRMWDLGQCYGQDGVEITTRKVEFHGTEDLLPPEVREAIRREQYKADGLCEECGENPCHVYCKLQSCKAASASRSPATRSKEKPMNETREAIAARMLALFGEGWEASHGWGWIRHTRLPYLAIQYLEHSGEYVAWAESSNNHSWSAKSKNPPRVIYLLIDKMEKEIEEKQYMIQSIKEAQAHEG